MSTRARHESWNVQDGNPPLNVLRFLGSDDAGVDSTKYCAIQFANPHTNGLPIWGPSNAGWTAIVERLTRQQTGYYGASPWWCNNGAFLWSGADSYLGFCPYPQNGSDTGTTHWWEFSGIAAGTDNLYNKSGAHVTVTHGTMRTQAIRIFKTVADSTKQALFYINLPSTASADVIDAPDGAYGGSATSANTVTFGESNPPNPVVRFGDSPWTDFGKERFSGDLGRIKIIAKALSESDIVSEANNMASLVTSDGQANIWWGKTNWRSLNDLTCDYGTGRTFAWADSTYKATLAVRGS